MQKIFSSKYFPAILGLFLILLSIVFVVVQYRQSLDQESQNRTGLDARISSLKSSIKNNPSVVKNYFELSNSYLQKVRETGDVSYYSKIETLLNKAKKIEPNNAEIHALYGSIALGRHSFKEAQTFAIAAIEQNPNRAEYFGLLGDAEIELGNYDAAIEAFQKMVNIRPDFSSYSRIAYIRELYGDIPGAKEMLKLALSSGSSFKENIAWVYVELGNLTISTDLVEAKKFYEQALVTLPQYSQAYEGLGRVAFAEGKTDEALAQFEYAFNLLPLAQYSAHLADIYAVKGDIQKSKQNITLTRLSFQSSSKSGVNTGLEEALFLADHDIELEKALVAAKRAYADRQNIYTADCLGWVYYKNGRFEEAAQYTKEALRLGEFDARILFHQGMITLKNGNADQAYKYLSGAYKINKHFSIKDSITLEEIIQNSN